MSVTEDRLNLLVENAPCWKQYQPWDSLFPLLLLPDVLPQIRAKGEILKCDPMRLLKSVGALFTEAWVKSNGSVEECDNKDSKFLVLQVVNRVLFELSKIDESVMDSSYVDRVIRDVFDFYKGPISGETYDAYRGKRRQRAYAERGLYVIRRNGIRVKWDANKVYKAILRAFLAWEMTCSNDNLDVVAPKIHENTTRATDRVVYSVTGLGTDMIHIEEIQDIVEKVLSDVGFAEISSFYSDYRKKRASLRKKKFLEDSSQYLSEYIDHRLFSRVDFAMIGLDLNMSREELARKLVQSLDIGVTDVDIANTILLNSRMLIELDPDFRFFAARILLSYVYEEVLTWKVEDGFHKLKSAHEEGFIRYIHNGIELGLLDPKMSAFDLQRISEKINPLADLRFDYAGIYTIYDRYLIQERKTDAQKDTFVLGKNGKRRLEVPQMMWMRVAMGLAINENDKNSAALSFYSVYSHKRFCSATTTLFNSGTVNPQLSSCFGVMCPDEISSIKFDEHGRPYHSGIFGMYTSAALISKCAGGLGIGFSSVRGHGAYINSTNGKSLGVIPFLRILNDVALAVNQGGRRRGVACAFLETWHNDIEEFLDLRKNTGDERRRTHDLHTANWVPDLFIKRAIKGEDWTLFRSDEVKDLHEIFGSVFETKYVEYEKMSENGVIFGRKIKASTLWRKMLEALFETGHPWITFKDPCNIRSPQDHVGVVHNLNLCTEIALNNSPEEQFVCNLGSLHMPVFVDPETKQWDWDSLSETVQLAIRMLDNVVDINVYPTIPAENANRRHRPLGLGIMGWQDILHVMEIPFDSEEAIELADKVTEFIAWHACYASVQLAIEKGPYSTFKGSKWHRGMMPLDTLELLERERGIRVDVSRSSCMDWDYMRKMISKHGLRNSNLLSIAPTATISNIFGCAPCTEPDFRQLFSKSTLSGEQLWLNPYLVNALKKKNIWGLSILEEIKYAKGEISQIEIIPIGIRNQFKSAFNIDPLWVVKASAVRQKWVDQAISTNLFIGDSDIRSISFIYLQAWLRGLKSTYYLKTKSASDIEDATLTIKRKTKEISRMSTSEGFSCSLYDSECDSCQ